MKKIAAFFQKETVLCIAALLAVASMFLVAPDKEYLEYIDFRTLALLFCLMSVMAGLQTLGVFDWIAGKFLQKVDSFGYLTAILVLLCFFFSMLITNDVALITFVPFTFTVLKLLGGAKESAIPIVAMQTIAANMGSMLTPVGNPQNLYLYGKSGFSLLTFLGVTFPYAGASLALIVLWCVYQGKKQSERLEVTLEDQVVLKGKEGRIAGYLALFVLSLLTVVRVLPYPVTLLCTVLGVLFLDKRALLQVDYSLLATFVGFFVFIGNMGRIPVFSEFLGRIVVGNEVYVALLASQAISNVPAALLLSGFSQNWEALIIGVGLGGLGTLIASMASLISYKYVAAQLPDKKGRYILRFTGMSLCFLAVLLLLYVALAPR